MHKLSYQTEEGWVAFVAPARYRVEPGQGAGRVRGHLHAGDPADFEGLLACLSGPVMLLYVLHTPRGEAAPGRYQSPELDAGAVRAFVRKFGDFLRSDARFDIWAHSPADGATVVWDRHDDIYLYGATERFVAALQGMGYQEGALARAGAHKHHYRQECDVMARALIGEFDWVYSPLRDEDEQ